MIFKFKDFIFINLPSQQNYDIDTTMCQTIGNKIEQVAWMEPTVCEKANIKS
jgi:hypothetical protein